MEILERKMKLESNIIDTGEDTQTGGRLLELKTI